MTAKRVINFSPGPSAIPLPVLEEAQKEFLNWHGTGISVTEMSHRSPEFQSIINKAEQSLREILDIPDYYEVLFMHGGGLGQSSCIPLNLLGENGTADYLSTGSWSTKSAKEAVKYGKINLVVPKPEKFTGIPDPNTWNCNPEASYFYYCDNETIEGIEFDYIPETNGVPLVCDMSSNILTRAVPIDKFALIFAGAQKNAGNAGLAIVIVREDMLGQQNPLCPEIFDYKKVASEGSLLNTPPCFNIYMTGLVLEWIKSQGGIKGIQEIAAKKSKLIYDIIDGSNGFYYCKIGKKDRSRINICFRIGGEIPDPQLEKEFLDEALKRDMIQLKGHRSVGGIRVSLYNAISLQDTEKLANLMTEFLDKHQK
ncbi:Phosphoserine aminotransferase [Chamberlinius hualienensis]